LRAAIAVVVALIASVFLLFVLAPVVGLVAAGGGRGLSSLARDGELRASLALTALTATIATLLGVVGGTPIAYLLARRDFRGRSIVAAAMELPLVAKRLAKLNRYQAIICLGAVIRGETSHDQHINRAVSTAITRLSLETNVPVLFGVLTCETMEQAIHRAGGNVGNKGAEAADAALQMVGLLKNIP